MTVAANLVALAVFMVVVYFPVLVYTSWRQKKRIEKLQERIYELEDKLYNNVEEKALEALNKALHERGGEFNMLLKDRIRNMAVSNCIEPSGTNPDYYCWSRSPDSGNRLSDR